MKVSVADDLTSVSQERNASADDLNAVLEAAQSELRRLGLGIKASVRMPGVGKDLEFRKLGKHGWCLVVDGNLLTRSSLAIRIEAASRLSALLPVLLLEATKELARANEAIASIAAFLAPFRKPA